MDHVFLGNVEDARNIAKLEKYKINYILNMMEDATKEGKKNDKKTKMQYGFRILIYS
jgi:hypothetical protein